LGSSNEQSSLLKIMSSDSIANNEKVRSVKELFNNSGASEATQNAVKDYTNRAFEVLEALNISEDKKQLLRLFGEQLMNRRV
jgi:geranylgeranyl diphosphate synthase type II